MKLEIKHLAPYLPFQPNVLHLERNIALKVTGIYKKYNTDEHFDILLLNWDLTLKSTEVKPILRPLSDLTKPITDSKGRKFILAKQLWSVSENDEDVFELFGTLPEYWAISLRALLSDYRNVDYGDIQEMLKYHFDIFGLIDQDLAIDINTLDK